MTAPHALLAFQLWSMLPKWVRNHQLATIPEPATTAEDDYSSEHVHSDEIELAHIILSHDQDQPHLHRPVLDIDFPVHVIPSSTHGHFHLYLDKQMTWEEYSELIFALAKAGIIEEGYAHVSDARKYTSVRLPWVRKQFKQLAAQAGRSGAESGDR